MLVATESLSAGAVDLFEQHGFKQLFAEDVMRRNLDTPLPDAPVPPDIRFATWTPALASEFFAVYQASFRERPGFPNWSQDEWVDWLGTENDDFRAKLSLLAYQDDLPVGFVVCAEGWIVQVGVLPEWRKRGIGLTLMIEVLKRFRAASGDHVLLDVNVNNPSAARLYERLGFERVGRRARYARVLA
jgi:ribosomal protein S18 acetylase RimI-like enzyme